MVYGLRPETYFGTAWQMGTVWEYDASSVYNLFHRSSPCASTLHSQCFAKSCVRIGQVCNTFLGPLPLLLDIFDLRFFTDASPVEL